MHVIDAEMMREICSKAAMAPRRRAHLNLHKSVEEDIHRLMMAAQPDSYFRPHRHSKKDRWELMICLKGSVDMLVFSPDGVLQSRYEISPGGSVAAVELDENTFHSLVVTKPDTVMMEVKRGPYEPTPEADFGSWAPAEGTPEVTGFMDWQRQAKTGDKAGL